MTALDVPRLLGAGAASLQEELAESDRVVRAPLALNRRIAVVQLRGGAGASATAASLGSLIARRRRGLVLGVDAAAGRRSLLWHAGLPDAERPRPEPRRSAPRSADDAVAGLPRNGSGLVAFDLRGDDHRAVPEAGWAAAVAPVARFTEVIVTDWGLRAQDADLGVVAAGSQAICLVCRADRGSLEEALAAAGAIAARPHRPRTVVAAIDLGGTAGRWPAILLAGAPAPVHRLPFEPARAAAQPLPSRRTRGATRTAMARLAAALLDQTRPRP